MLDLQKIKLYPAPAKEFHYEIHTKKQIVFHYTESGGNSVGDMNYLNNDSQGAVNAPFFIDRDGTIWQAFNSKYWSAHLGVPQSTLVKFNSKLSGKNLHESSIAIELDSWGRLTEKNGKYLTVKGTEVKPENVVTYNIPYRGFKHYEKFYPEQLAALKELTEYLCRTYKIPTTYNSDMWDVNERALSGTPGIWTHTSYRESSEKKKFDCHPQTELIEMIKSLTI